MMSAMMIIVDICILDHIQGCCMQCPVAVWMSTISFHVEYCFHCKVSHYGTSVKV